MAFACVFLEKVSCFRYDNWFSFFPFFNCCSSTVVSISLHHSSLPHPSPPPTLPCLALARCPLHMFLDELVFKHICLLVWEGLHYFSVEGVDSSHARLFYSGMEAFYLKATRTTTTRKRVTVLLDDQSRGKRSGDLCGQFKKVAETTSQQPTRGDRLQNQAQDFLKKT